MRLRRHREDGALQLSDVSEQRLGARRVTVVGGPDVSVAARRLRDASAPELAPRRVATLPFEVDEPKVHIPALRSGTVSRTGLVNRLRASAPFPVMTMTAPAGYGKTTLLAQWAARDSRPFAWVSPDDRDDDPLVLLRSVAAALHTVKPLDRSVLDALATPAPSLWSSGVPRLASAFTAFKGNLVLVLDDAHLLRSREATEVVAILADHVAAGSTLVLSGRAMPALPTTAFRTAGKLFELGVDQIALTPKEGQLLLRATGADLSLGEVTELVSRYEGWPAALYLAALALRDDEARRRKGANRKQSDTGDENIAEYLRAEYLSRLRPSALQFLRRTSVLDRMCGALCDAVLQEPGSALELESIERSNLFLVPLDRQRAWYRYHHLFRDLLRRELAEREPELEAVLHRRAAAWYEKRGDSDSALEHAWAAGDVNHVARILTAIALPTYSGGRVATVERWLTGFDDESLLERYPEVALQGSFIHALRGRSDLAERWLRIVERQAAGRPSLRPGIAAVRATMGLDGVYQMIADAESALSGLERDSQFRPSALMALGIGYALLGQDRRADVIFAMAGDEAERLGATDTRVVAISERSLLAAAHADQSAAESLALEARELVEQGRLDFYPTSSMAIAVSARAELRHGRWEEARALLDKSRELRSGLTHAFLPWLTLQTLLEEGRAYLAIRDVESVRSRVTQIRSLLEERPFVGVLAEQAGELERAVEAMRQRDDAARGLTAAELRLLPLLATHLSFREIGETLFVSRNTVKTQAISVYRKLEVSSRSEAIAHAVELGLIEPVT